MGELRGLSLVGTRPAQGQDGLPQLFLPIRFEQNVPNSHFQEATQPGGREMRGQHDGGSIVTHLAPVAKAGHRIAPNLGDVYQ